MLHLASYWNCANVAKALIENGADINAEHDNKITPLHIAAHYGHEDVVTILTGKGAIVDAKMVMDGLLYILLLKRTTKM